MEVVGVVASFTGILAFAGQALEGILQLRTFFKDVTLAPRRSGELLKDLEGLSDTMLEIEELIETLQGREIVDPGAASNSLVLEAHLSSCAEDVAIWVGVTKRADPRSERGLKAFFRKVKIAADKSGFEELGRKILSHRQRIGISLSVLGRFLDHAGIKRLHDLSSKFDGLTEAHIKLNDRINTKLIDGSELHRGDLTLSAVLKTELQPLESQMRASAEDQLERMSTHHSESQQSIHSLSQSVSSLASHISHLLEKTHSEKTGHKPKSRGTEQTAGLTHEWCCDALSGIDDAFDERGSEQICIYCSKTFIARIYQPYSSHAKAKHLSEVHSFGSCNLGETYMNWDQLKEHLRTHHNLDDKKYRLIGRFQRRKHPPQLYRGDTHGQPLKIEQSNEHVIIAVRLTQALYEAGLIANFDSTASPLRDVRSFSPLAESALDRLDIAFKMDRIWEMERKLLDDVACRVEELILSGGYDEPTELRVDKLTMPRTDRLNDPFSERFLIDETKRKHVRTPCVSAGYTKRNRINDWLFQIFEESRTLRSLLRNGNIISGMGYATSSKWVIPVVKFWDVDEAAIKVDQFQETSDGAVDSREGLHIDPHQEPPANSQKIGQISAMGPLSSNVSSQFSAEKKHKCEFCDRRFVHPNSRKHHMHRHTGEKCFRCDAEGCGRRFSLAANLERHRTVHHDGARGLGFSNEANEFQS